APVCPPRFLFGGGWCPEQWDPATWGEDIALMRRAKVNPVSLGIFSWSSLEPAEGVYETGWLEEVIDLLTEAGIGFFLATPTASPPPWFTLAHPEAMPVTPAGVRPTPGSRATSRVRAPAYRARRRRGAPAHRPDARRALRRASRSARLAPAQRVRDARPRPCGRSRLPRLAAAPLRLSPGAEPAVVHRVLVPGLRRLGGDHAPAGHAVPAQPGPADRLPPLQLRRDAGGDDRAARRDPRRRLHRTGDHELHAAHLEPPRAVGVGGGAGRGLVGSLPRHHRPRRGGPRRLRLGPRPLLVRRALGAHGAERRGHRTGRSHRRQERAADAPPLPGVHRPRLPELPVLPVAGLARRRRAVAQRPGPARRRLHGPLRGRVRTGLAAGADRPRGRPPGRRAAGRGGRGDPLARRRVVGAGDPAPAQRCDLLFRGGARDPPLLLAGGDPDGLRAAGGGREQVPAAGGAVPVPALGR